MHVSDGGVRSAGNRDARPERGASIDELLDRAVAAINRGDQAAATALAGQVLAVDRDNVDATDLLGAPGGGGEIRRLTILFADLVDSTVLSTRVEPETYRLLVGRYRDLVLSIVDRFEGHIGSTKGDGLLAVFGYPTAHDNDVRRAVQAGLEITRAVTHLSQQAQRRFGVDLAVRVGVHRGLVYLDTTQDDVYGLAANLAARVSSLAPPGTEVVSDAIETLARKDFELEDRPAAPVKGVQGLITHYRVVGERSETGRIWRGPLVGRDREVSWLDRSWARAKAGTLSTAGVVFRGEPGIGKSRLAAAAIDIVQRSDAVVLELAGSPFHTDVGLHPVRTLIERRCGIDRSTDPVRRLRLLGEEIQARGLDPATTMRLLAPVLGIAPEHGYQPAPAEGRKLQELIASRVQDYLRACLGEGPALLVAEDVHWFDPSTIDVLGALLGANPRRLLVVVICRPEGRLPDGWPVKVFDLAPLTDEQTDELIVALDPTVDAGQRAAVRERCDGIPFHIEQVVAGLELASGGESAVPDALYEPLFARLRARANVVPVLEAAAVIGRHMDRDLLCATVDLSDDEVDAVIDELEDALVLEPWGPDRWRFRHELLREVAAELAPPSVRRGLHTRLADGLGANTTGGEPDWRLVATHYEQGERFDQAASAYQQASEQARRRGALAEAVDYLTRAITQLDRASPGPDRDRRETAVRLRRGFLGAAEGGLASASDFERCMELVETAEQNNDELLATLTGLNYYYWLRGDLRRVARVIEIIGANLIDLQRWPVQQSLFEHACGVLAQQRGEFDEARSLLQRATTSWAAVDDHDIDAHWFMPVDPLVNAQLHLALDGMLRADLTAAHAALAQAAQRVAQLGFPQGPFNHAHMLWLEAWISIEAG